MGPVRPALKNDDKDNVQCHFIVKKSLFGGKGDPFANLESDFNLRDTKFTFYPDGGEKLKLKSEEVLASFPTKGPI